MMRQETRKGRVSRAIIIVVIHVPAFPDKQRADFCVKEIFSFNTIAPIGERNVAVPLIFPEVTSHPDRHDGRAKKQRKHPQGSPQSPYHTSILPCDSYHCPTLRTPLR